MNRDESKKRKTKTENASCRMVVTFQSIAEAHMRDATQTLRRPGRQTQCAALQPIYNPLHFSFFPWLAIGLWFCGVRSKSRAVPQVSVAGTR